MQDPRAQKVGDAIARVVPPRQRSQGKGTSDGIRVAVAAYPRATADLKRELELAKSALLYADRVTICSGNSTLLASLAAITDLNEQQKLKFIRDLAPTLMPGRKRELELLMGFMTQRHQGGVGFRLALQFRQQLEIAWRDIRQRVSQMLDEAGAAELEPAIEQGLVTALDEGFRGEVAVLYTTEVQAAMDEVHSALKGPHFTRIMLRAGLESAPSSGLLGLVAFELAHLGPIVSGLLTALASHSLPRTRSMKTATRVKQSLSKMISSFCIEQISS